MVAFQTRATAHWPRYREREREHGAPTDPPCRPRVASFQGPYVHVHKPSRCEGGSRVRTSPADARDIPRPPPTLVEAGNVERDGTMTQFLYRSYYWLSAPKKNPHDLIMNTTNPYT
jgi:hypothetical protein